MTKVELFGRCVIWHKTNTAFYKKNIIPTVKHGGGSVMVRCCFAASGHGRLAVIDGTMWILYSIRKSWRRMSGHQFVTSSSNALGLCSRTMNPNTPASPPPNGSRKTTLRFWSDQVKVQTYIRLKFCGMTLNGPFMLQNSNVAELKQLQWRVGQNSSTVMWNTHCQLLQMLDCSCCCKGGHNQLLHLGGNYFFT